MKILKRLFIIFIIFIIFVIPSFSYNNINNKKNDITEVSSSLAHINTYSKNIIVIDRKTSLVLYEKNAYQKTAMASTTKIMTCIIAIENSSLNNKVRISKKSANATGSTLGLKENSEITMNDLLYGLMLRSGNDCAIAIAEHISGTVENYLKLMNKKGLELGLKNTHFVTPHGLDDENHYTTAYDLAILTDYALKNEIFKKIVSTKNYNVFLNGNQKNISNTNELLGINGVYGVKTGFTFNAGRCLVTSFKKDDFDIIIVVLGADTKKIRGLDTLNLIEYITTNFKYVDISGIIIESFDNYKKNYLNTIILEKTRDFPSIRLDNNYETFIPLNVTENLKLETKIYMPNKLSPKVNINNPIGSIYVYNNTALISQVNIFLEKELKKSSWIYYFKKFFII